ncbi:MAG: hypothetical protein GXY15_06965 [Candidatus Hydrogenedentes bacterium]|nr:hypothetical protein [Candidatus Hydrogenedentota bacterium]
MVPSNTALPPALAVAGGWGHIGGCFARAALGAGVRVFVHDPGPRPQDEALADAVEVRAAEEFYALPVPFYHLALQPAHRDTAFSLLAARPEEAGNPLVLVEKPLAPPFDRERALRARDTAASLPGTVLFDFIELYRPLTRTVFEYLSSFQHCRIHEIALTRTKDREDPAVPRNHIVTLPVQYQETVHCAAWALACLEHVSAGLPENGAVEAWGTSAPHSPPNPERYPEPVDGFFEGGIALGETRVTFLTDFRRGTPRSQYRRVVGEGDGRRFVLETEYLPGAAWLKINGESVPLPREDSPHLEALRGAWRCHLDRMNGTPRHMPLPGPAFAHRTWLVSTLLWNAAHGKPATGTFPEDNG